jgi:hypothetical protein
MTVAIRSHDVNNPLNNLRIKNVNPGEERDPSVSNFF